MSSDSRVQDFARRFGLDEEGRRSLSRLLKDTVQDVIRSLPPEPTSEHRGPGRPGSTAAAAPPISLEATAEPASARYKDLGLIGTGGMAEVRRAFDPQLRRVAAMKALWPEFVRDSASIGRFIEEARTTAGLEHPGIVPVHEIGRLADGRWYFTMQEVRGRTLAEVVDAVHAASPPGRWGRTEDGWTFRGLLEAFRKVCETVAYAHSRGVIHRDLKPRNIMVGGFGEALVLDWGLAKRLGDETPLPSGTQDPLFDELSGLDDLKTPPGWIVGTPAYMPPEQAEGGFGDLDPRADVYALGAILYRILSGRAPYAGRDGRDVIKQVLRGPPPPLDVPATAQAVEPESEGDTVVQGSRPPLPIPDELRQACERAMDRRAELRYADAGALAADIASWLAGEKRRDGALKLVAQAEELRPEVRRRRKQARTLRQEAEALLADVPKSAPVERKRGAWTLQDTADRLEREADFLDAELTQLGNSALSHDPDSVEARELLADHYRELHEAAEAARDVPAARRWETMLRAHDLGRHAAWLRGDGALSLGTDPPGAEVLLHRWVERDRVLVAEPAGELGTTPLRARPLPRGSLLLELRAPGREPVRLPVRVDRCAHLEFRGPDGARRSIPLPPAGELGPDDVYVPPGPFFAGGDPEAPGSGPARTEWLEGFVARRFPVTNAEYIAFLDGLVAAGREEEALRCLPRHRATKKGTEGASAYERRPDGRFALGVDADGDRWSLDWPVILVDWPSAAAYCAWLAERTGRPWRLPTALEWEKAARGADGRVYPWGDRFDPTFCLMRDSHGEGRQVLASVRAYPTDESPYGIRGLAGNTSDWCADAAPDQGEAAAGREYRVHRGGSWIFSARGVRSAAQWSDGAGFRATNLGFRPVRSWPG